MLFACVSFVYSWETEIAKIQKYIQRFTFCSPDWSLLLAIVNAIVIGHRHRQSTSQSQSQSSLALALAVALALLVTRLPHVNTLSNASNNKKQKKRRKEKRRSEGEVDGRSSTQQSHQKCCQEFEQKPSYNKTFMVRASCCHCRWAPNVGYAGYISEVVTLS